MLIIILDLGICKTCLFIDEINVEQVIKTTVTKYLFIIGI